MPFTRDDLHSILSHMSELARLIKDHPHLPCICTWKQGRRVGEPTPGCPRDEFVKTRDSLLALTPIRLQSPRIAADDPPDIERDAAAILIELRNWFHVDALDLEELERQGGSATGVLILHTQSDRDQHARNALAMLADAERQLNRLFRAAKTRPKGKAGRRGYTCGAAKDHARKLQARYPEMTAKELRAACLEKFGEDASIPPDGESFRRWLNRENKKPAK